MSSEISKKLTLDWPPHISYDSSDERISENFSERTGFVAKRTSIFYKKRLLDIFLFALALGKRKGIRTPLKKKSQSMPTDALTEEEIWLMTSVALSEPKSDLDILTKPAEIVKICEEYANTGINDLITRDYNSSLSDPLGPYEKLLEEGLKEQAK